MKETFSLSTPYTYAYAGVLPVKDFQVQHTKT